MKGIHVQTPHLCAAAPSFPSPLAGCGTRLLSQEDIPSGSHGCSIQFPNSQGSPLPAISSVRCSPVYLGP